MPVNANPQIFNGEVPSSQVKRIAPANIAGELLVFGVYDITQFSNSTVPVISWKKSAREFQS